jgi:hypothetical protein
VTEFFEGVGIGFCIGAVIMFVYGFVSAALKDIKIDEKK